MTIPVVVTMRSEFVPDRSERRDALDRGVIDFLRACGCTPCPVPNNPAVAVDIWRLTGAAALVLSGGGSIAALILTQVVYKKPDLTMVLNGALAGLVSITAEPLAPTLGQATLIGAVGGVIVVFAVPFLDKIKIDDVVGAIPVHLLAGIWGTLAVPLTNGDASFGTQIISIVIVGVFTVAASAGVWLVLKATMGLRVDEETEINGLDMAELGMEAYPEFSKG